MASDEILLLLVREALMKVPKVEEKKMFRGICFMVNGKMCVTVGKDELMCRFDPLQQDNVLAKKGTREMVMKGKVLNGYVYIGPEGWKIKEDFDYWIKLALEFNKKAKASKKKKK